MVQKLVVFYSDDGMIFSRGPEWLQGYINYLIGLSRKISLEANIAKSKTMNFQSGEIQSGMSAELFNRSSTREGTNYCDCL